MDFHENYQRWTQYLKLDPSLKSIMDSYSLAEIEDAFGHDLEFGTAGLRGVLGPGTNRMNIYVIRKASEVFARYLLRNQNEAASKGVVIAHDNRAFSKEFSVEAASVIASHGIRVYLFDALRPTPELSFAVRYLHAAGGIVITASHNPKEYNGYKVYDEEGCQLTPEQIDQIIAIYPEVKDEFSIGYESKEIESLISIIDPSIDEIYYGEVQKIRLQPELDASKLRIVYSPQHGTGMQGVSTLLRRNGFDFHVVESQAMPDPNFTNTLSPNPEEKNAYVAAIELAQRIQADLIITTDPDADRVGVVELDDQGNPTYFTGNQMGALLLHYILSQGKKQGKDFTHSIVFDTIVTSALGGKIALHYGCHVESTLTGFKYIGKKVKEYEGNEKCQFLFGYEESYGFLISPICRDKDALQASLMIAEMTLFYKLQGKRLTTVLESLFQTYGTHYEEVRSVSLKGIEGAKQIQEIMKNLRKTPVSMLAGYPVMMVEDYWLSHCTIRNHESTPILLPKSDVIRYTLKDGSRIAIRPSGTEPKCKFYYNVVASSLSEAKEKAKSLDLAIRSIIQ